MAVKKSLVSEADQAAKESRRWKKELQLAGKREKPWRDESEKIIKRYRGEERKMNRFNVLWANTEILRPAIYNSRPNPDVRRRFRDADPVGKAVSELLERSLMVMIDADSFDQALKNDVLDGLLPGRGLSRIRYIPSLTQVGEAANDSRADTESSAGKPDSDDDSYGKVADEEVEYEQVCVEHVDWRDYREGYGRTWDEVPCTFYRHKLTRADAEEKFEKDDIARVKYSAPNDEDRQQKEDSSETEKVAEFWEVWDKVGEKVFFIQEDIERLIYPRDNPTGEPPLTFTGFFPHPDPLMIVENTGSRIPIPLFTLYEQQANELDRISGRINKIVAAARLRGIYDAKLVEIPDLLDKDDNELTPVQNAQAWGDKGLDGAISWFPVEKAAAVLEGLYEARDRQKAIIDELLGINDIMRGATDPQETKGAQDLKATYGSIRLQRMQKEVQRYAKDLLRLASEAICQKFAPQTFTEMTELKFPTAADKQALQAQIQLAQQQAAMLPRGMPPPPMPNAQLLQVPSWEDILAVMRSSAMRRFKVDVETDSTVASTLNSDMAGLSQVLTAVHEALTGLAPIVQSGALPVDAAKELVMTIIRRARMGIAVEDAFDKLKAPNPPPPPPMPQVEAAKIKAQSDQQLAQIKVQGELQVAQVEHQQIAGTEVARAQAEVQKAQSQAQIDAQLDAVNKAHELQLKAQQIDAETQRMAMQLENERLIADANNQTKIMVAEIQAKMQAAKMVNDQALTQMKGDQAGEQQDKQIAADQTATETEAPAAATYEPQESAILQGIQSLIEHMSKPRRVIRDDNGRIVGVQ